MASLSRKKRIEENRRDKKDLVFEGKSHGILVYAGKKPIGWCQFGTKEELPRIDAKRTYRSLILPTTRRRLWRITCFVVAKEFRRRGVAGVALRAAIESIRKSGGGTIEAYPVTSMKAVGVWFGTVGMFEREGFDLVSPLGRSKVVMRKTI